jgi:hypothetical protein
MAKIEGNKQGTQGLIRINRPHQHIAVKMYLTLT